LSDRISKKKQDQKQIKDNAGGFSIMNALNIWNTRREDEGGSLTVEKEEAELRNKTA
jgi:hypothetical protein